MMGTLLDNMSVDAMTRAETIAVVRDRGAIVGLVEQEFVHRRSQLTIDGEAVNATIQILDLVLRATNLQSLSATENLGLLLHIIDIATTTISSSLKVMAVISGREMLKITVG